MVVQAALMAVATTVVLGVAGSLLLFEPYMLAPKARILFWFPRLSFSNATRVTAGTRAGRVATDQLTLQTALSSYP